METDPSPCPAAGCRTGCLGGAGWISGTSVIGEQWANQNPSRIRTCTLRRLTGRREKRAPLPQPTFGRRARGRRRRRGGDPARIRGICRIGQRGDGPEAAESLRETNGDSIIPLRSRLPGAFQGGSGGSGGRASDLVDAPQRLQHGEERPPLLVRLPAGVSVPTRTFWSSGLERSSWSKPSRFPLAFAWTTCLIT